MKREPEILSVEEGRKLLALKPKHNKYRNRFITIDGIKFQSEHEANRYIFLKSEVTYGRIYNLQLQVEFELIVEGKLVCKYVADFVYYRKIPGVYDNSEMVVEDAKSEITRRKRDYRIKNKLMKAVHGIEIMEV